MIHLFHDWDSLMSIKVRACLAEKGIDWTSRRVILRDFEHLQSEYLELNPNGVVPTLVHDGAVIHESSMINEYLDEVFPKPALKPATAYDRARMRVWSKYFDDVIHPTLRPATFQLMIRQRFSNMPPAQLEESIKNHPMPERAQAFRVLADSEINYDVVLDSIHKLEKIIARMELILCETPWLAGESYSLADINTMPLIDRVERLQFDFIWQYSPGVRAWIERVKSKPMYQMAIPDKELRMPIPEEDVITKIRALAA